MTELKYTDDELIKMLSDKARAACEDCGFIKETVGCENCTFEAVKRLINLINTQKAEIKQYEHDQKTLIAERDQARRDCAVAEGRQLVIKSEDVFKNLKSNKVILIPSAKPSIEIIPTIDDFKTALLKKIFPYDAVDKKQYSINAYAVERAIIEVAEQMTEVHK